MKNRTAFTLAEVLITLLIIGVVASLTIPAVITVNQNSTLRSTLKKTYSDLSTATRLVIQAKGGSLTGLCEDDDNDCYRELFANYLSYVKKCDMGTDTHEGNCWVTADKMKSLDGNTYGSAGDWDDGDSGMVLNNGVFLDFYGWGKYCSWDLSYDYSGSLRMCGNIYVDLNGFKGPNIAGRDIFLFIVVPNGLRPVGTDKDLNFNDCGFGSGQDGWGCAVWVLQEKDY